MNEPEQVLVVLTSAKGQHVPFESAWFQAMRAICPPRSCNTILREQIDEARAVLHETKPQWRAAYENRQPTETELRRSFNLAERRLDRLLAPEEIAA